MRIEGFASIKYLEFDWGAREMGITIISARNGSGKSKLINALYWALFGDSISGAVGMWEHIRPKEYNGTLVEINLEKDGEEYKIIRCFEYKGKVEGRAGKMAYSSTRVVNLTQEEIRKGYSQGLIDLSHTLRSYFSTRSFLVRSNND